MPLARVLAEGVRTTNSACRKTEKLEKTLDVSRTALYNGGETSQKPALRRIDGAVMRQSGAAGNCVFHMKMIF
jgi:hypothetical protein